MKKKQNDQEMAVPHCSDNVKLIVWIATNINEILEGSPRPLSFVKDSLACILPV